MNGTENSVTFWSTASLAAATAWGTATVVRVGDAGILIAGVRAALWAGAGAARPEDLAFRAGGDTGPPGVVPAD